MNCMSYEIVATLGPGAQSVSIWEQMVAAGVSAFRLNTSHLSLAQTLAWLERLQSFFAAQRPGLAVVLDLQGSKWRLGDFPACELRQGQVVQLILAAAAEEPDVLPLPHADFFRAALPGARLSLNDAKVYLQVEQAQADRLLARVIQGGALGPRKGITLAEDHSAYRLETLNARDSEIFAATRSLGFVRYAISYLKDGVEMERYRQLFGPSVFLIAKLERQSALESVSQIAAFADQLWLCRGDLGAELGAKAMAQAVYRFGQALPNCPRTALLAGQVLEHMTDHPTPTRSEVCFLHDALQAGYGGVVLSDETALGRYPVEACQVAAMFNN